MLAESAEGTRFSKGIPIEKVMDDCMLAWGQNGEAVRPEQGYPLRLISPGYEGIYNVKWLRRLEIFGLARDRAEGTLLHHPPWTKESLPTTKRGGSGSNSERIP